MSKIKKIPTCDIPDGYYAYHWSREGEILRDKINEIIDAIDGVIVSIETNCPPPVPGPMPPKNSSAWVNPPVAPLRKEDDNA